MIVLDEQSMAKNMDSKGFNKMCSTYELSIYGKWLESKGKSIKEIENELIEFSKKHDKDFNYQIHFYKIDRALKNISEYDLRKPISTIVTKDEWDYIFKLDNDKYRRILFVMLVVSKFLKKNNTRKNKKNSFDDYGLFNITDSELCKLAKVSFSPVSERDKMFKVLFDMGLVDIISKKHTFRVVKFVNNDSNPFITVNDYSNIIGYYERQTGSNIGECVKCKKLFKQSKTKPADYCYKHRGYVSLNQKTLTCTDCNIEFVVDSKANKKIRCDKCQNKYRSEYKKLHYKNQKMSIRLYN